MQDGAEPLGPIRVGRQAERDAGGLDALLGAADPLRHRRFGHEKGVGDLCGREAADRAQGERDRRRTRQRGMTAHEEQDERVVLVHPALDASCAEARSEVVKRRLGRDLQDDRRLAAAPGQLGAQVIRHASRGDLDQPAARVVGNALLRPLHGRREECLLHGVFGGGKVAESPDDRAENLRRELAQQVLASRAQRAAVTCPRAVRSSLPALRSAC